MELIENGLLQIIKLFDYIQLILIFTSLVHFTERFLKVSINQMGSSIETKSDPLRRKKFTLQLTYQVHLKCT